MLSSCALYYLFCICIIVQYRSIFMLRDLEVNGTRVRKHFHLLLLWELCMVIPLPCFTTASFLSYSVHSVLPSFFCVCVFFFFSLALLLLLSQLWFSVYTQILMLQVTGTERCVLLFSSLIAPQGWKCP